MWEMLWFILLSKLFAWKTVSGKALFLIKQSIIRWSLRSSKNKPTSTKSTFVKIAWQCFDIKMTSRAYWLRSRKSVTNLRGQQSPLISCGLLISTCLTTKGMMTWYLCASVSLKYCSLTSPNTTNAWLSSSAHSRILVKIQSNRLLFWTIFATSKCSSRRNIRQAPTLWRNATRWITWLRRWKQIWPRLLSRYLPSLKLTSTFKRFVTSKVTKSSSTASLT